MDKMLDLRHRLWVRAQLATPPLVRPLLHKAQRIALMSAHPCMTVYRWEGENLGGALTASYAGFEYAELRLKSQLFSSEPVEHEIESVPMWRPDHLADCTDADVSYVVADEMLVRRLPREGALVMPFKTRLTVDVRGEWADVEKQFHHHLRKYELKQVRKYGYTYETSNRQSDFDMHYHSMYAPTMENRHGSLATHMLLTYEETLEYFRRGLLLLVKREDKYVAGAVLQPEREVLYHINVGVLDGSEQLMKEFAVAAVYNSMFHWANQQGFHSVDLWGSPPLLTHLFFYKRKWGASVGVSPTMAQRFWLKIRRDTPAVRQFLKDNPSIVLDDRGKLWGLVVTDEGNDVDPEQKAAWSARCYTPGLEGLLFRSVNDLMNANLKVVGKNGSSNRQTSRSAVLE